MSYIITNKEVFGETITTDVIFTLSDGSELETRISHFMPQNIGEIFANIERREASEQLKIDSTKKNNLLLRELRVVDKKSE